MAKNLTGHMALLVAAKAIRCKTLQGKLLLLYYCGNADSTGYFYKSYVDAVIETGISERTIRRYNEEWEKHGFMRTVEPAKFSGKSTDYYLSIPKIQAWAKASPVDKLKDAARIAGKERVKAWRENNPRMTKKPVLQRLQDAICVNGQT